MPQQIVANAFENGPFTGNPAAVVPLDAWPDGAVLQAIATQNNLSETAFFVDGGERIALRWFTPTAEIELCGHATLATAHALFSEMGDTRDRLVFDTLGGELIVERAGDAYSMDFPAIALEPVEEPDALVGEVFAAAGVERGEVFVGGGWVYLVVAEAAIVRNLTPDATLAAKLPHGGFWIGAAGDAEADIVTRAFAPGVGIPEDPATGSIHCGFAPFWGARLGKRELTSHQASARGGFFRCRWRPEDGRVDLIGTCRTFSRGEIEL